MTSYIETQRVAVPTLVSYKRLTIGFILLRLAKLGYYVPLMDDM